MYRNAVIKSGNTYSSGYIALSEAKVTLTFTEPGFRYGGLPVNGYWSGFTGDEKDLVCLPSNFDCKPIANPPAPSVSYFQPTGVRGDIGVYFTKHVKILSPHPQYKGLSIDLNMDLSYPRTSQEYQNYNQEAVEKFIQTTLLEIKNRTADKKVIEELDQFDVMVETIMFF